MTIEESNKLIAEFMGWKFIDNGDGYVDTSLNGKGRFTEKTTLIPNFCIALKYHSSWNRLMPVIEKISKEPLIGAETAQDVCYPVTFGMPHTDGTKMFRFAGCALSHLETLIEAAYSAVIDFIQYHNEQSTEPQPEGKGKEVGGE